MKISPLFLLPFLCLAPYSQPQARELGRLFFTPEQRQQLESGQLRGSAASDGATASLVVNGIVQKHGGKRTVWINGVPQVTAYSNEHTPAATPVAVPGKNKAVELKVGQKLLLDSSTQTTSEPAKQ